MVAVCDRSMIVRRTWSSLPSSATPPIRSASFSFLASARASSEVARLSESANTEEPRTFGRMKASAWIETNRSAFTLRAFSTRTSSGRK